MTDVPPAAGSPICFTIEEELPAGLAQAWRLVSDTDTFNRVAGIHFTWTDRQTADGRVERTAVMRSFGIQTKVEELSYDFEAPHRFRIVRRFVDGPASWNVVELGLRPSADGASTHLQYTVQLWPRVGLLRPVVSLLAWLARRDLAAAFAAYRALLAEDGTPRSLLPAPQAGRARAPLAAAAAGVAPAAVGAALEGLIRAAPDHVLDRLEPRPLAREWGLSEDDVLAGCLAAVEARILHLRWDVLCPSCLGAEAMPSLDEARGRQRHCPSCDLVYGADDPEAVAVSFRPAIRDFSATVQCMGSPQRTPRVLARADIPPGGQVEWVLSMRPGAYRVRRNDALGWTCLEVRDGHDATELTATVGDNDVAPAVLRAAPGWVRVVLRSVASAPARVLIERRWRPPDTMTAGELLERKSARTVLARCGLLPAHGVQLRPVGLLAVEVFSAGDETVSRVDAVLKTLAPASLHRDGGLLIGTWRDFTQALRAARHLHGSLHLCAAVGYGAAVFPGPGSPPMGTATGTLLAALRGALPGHTVVPRAHLDLPPVHRALDDADDLDVVAGPELEGPSCSLLIFRSAPTFSLPAPKRPGSAAGSVLRDRYQLDELLGQGGFGAVYKGTDTASGGTVVVKLLLPGQGATPAAIQAFFEEARVCAELDHPRVVGVRDFGHTDDGQLFLVMDHVAGLTLEELHQEQGPLGPDTVRRMAIEVLAALAHVHERGLLHRDIKPANIMMADAGARLIDFGVALRLQDTPEGEEQSVAGTLRYISPEALAGDPQDVRTDLYSLGLVMFEMLSGGLPEQERAPIQMAFGRTARPLPPVVEMCEQALPPALAAIVDRVVQREPAERFASAAEMAAALEGLG